MSFKTKYPHIAYHVGDDAAEAMSHHKVQLEGCDHNEVVGHNRVCIHSPICSRYKSPYFEPELCATENAFKIVESQVGRQAAKSGLGSKFATPLQEEALLKMDLPAQRRAVDNYCNIYRDAHSELCVASTLAAFGRLTHLEYDTGVGKGASGPGKNIDARGELEGAVCNFEVSRRIDSWLEDFDGEDIQLSTGLYVRSTGAKSRATLSEAQRDALTRAGKNLSSEPDYDETKPAHMGIADKFQEKGAKFPDGKECNIVVITTYGGMSDASDVQDAVYGSLICNIDRATGKSTWVTSPGGLFHDDRLSQVWAVLYINAYGYLEGLQRRVGGEHPTTQHNRLFLNGFSEYGKDWEFADRVARHFDAKLVRATSQGFVTV